jgi:cytochrome bd ubiquinol oxidase subunit I
MDALLLARIQFAANISFHILFPTITIALAWVLLAVKLASNRTGDPKWMEIYGFWVKVFALSFAVGVVTGITMSFQFGTNWPGFMERASNIAGPLLAFEVLTAFFLEATFVGIMLFGMRRVPNWMHTLATALVAGGTTLSAFWILALNSWMQTPSGYLLTDGIFHAADWAEILFNPSLPYRLTHMLIASGLTVSFLIAGLSSYRWLKGQRSGQVMTALRLGVGMAAVLAPVQIFVGDQHGLNTLEYQPQKVAAIEANWETRDHVPLVLFALPDESARENRFEITIPDGASLILRHSAAGEVPGLDPNGVHPPVAPVFFAFRLMVGLGFLMLAASWTGVWVLKRRKDLTPWLARTYVAMTFAGWLATLSGWYVTEIGRQPWMVQGLLRIADVASGVPAPVIGLSLAGYLTVYAVLLAAYVGVLFYLARRSGGAEDLTKMDPAAVELSRGAT